MIALAQQSNILDFPSVAPQGRNEWYTPARYIEAARLVMGGIDLDPASCEMANRTVKATQYYTQAENGLLQPWYGNVWMNPPYSETGRWTCRIIAAYKRREIEQAVIAVNVSSDTHWFQALCEYIYCLVHGRIDFDNPVKESIRPRFPSSFFYLGPHEQKFIDIFSQFGTIAKRVSQPRHTIAIPSLWEVAE